MNMLTGSKTIMADKMLELAIQNLAVYQLKQEYKTNGDLGTKADIEELHEALLKDPDTLDKLVTQMKIHLESEVSILLEKQMR